MENDEMDRLEEMLNLKSDVSPRPSTIGKLHDKLRENNRSVVSELFSAKVPAWVAIAAALIVGLIVSMLSADPGAEPKVVQKFVVKSDTVFITRRDTITVERVIYRNAKPSKVLQVRHADTGSSMKDKEELQNLLVSGSD